MTLTKNHEYYDGDGDRIEVQAVDTDAAEGDEAVGLIAAAGGGTYVLQGFAAPLALNVLGYDRPDDDPLATAFGVGESTAHIATSRVARDNQLHLAAALLKAVDAHDRREVRRATDEERRKAAAKSLGDTVAALRRSARSNEFDGDEIGKLREALGRYDAALAN